MPNKEFGKGYWKTFSSGIEREWVITNGIGGYAGSSIIGAHTRKHHGMLIASLHAPIERYMVFSKINETIKMEKRSYSLAATQRKGGKKEEGQHYLQRFLFDSVPTFVYHAEGFHMEKTIAMEYGKNTTAIGYDIQNGNKETVLTLVPLFNFRDHNNGSKPSQLLFQERLQQRTLILQPQGGTKTDSKKARENQVAISFSINDGEFIKRDTLLDKNMELQTEIDTGMSSFDNNYTPYEIQITLKPHEKKRLSVICSLESSYEADAFVTIENARLRASELIAQAGLKDDFAGALVQAADQFIVHRESTGYKTILAGLPWFTDWGRDTMIALQGLTLVTKRFEDARGILKTFASYVKDGQVPNMFPDEGMEPLYNTADASMWYFYSVDRFLNYTQTAEDYDFIYREIYPKLTEIIEYYKRGTHFSIYMDKDCLIHAGSGFDQVTWMDVRVGEWVVTPRHGKPVEINALWYNALKVMERLSARFEEAYSSDFSQKQYPHAAYYSELADRVKESFLQKFWNESGHCLADVVEDRNKQDKSIRPNQIWAVSLPYTMLPQEKELLVVDTVISHLYASYGLRSLSPWDKNYKGIYFGELHNRDAAYHQGTVWAFPLGGLITAYVKVHEYSKESIDFAYQLLAPLKDHLMDGCIGQIAEIFDGDEPHISRGCYGQAWSVGEILRAYAEDILPYRFS